LLVTTEYTECTEPNIRIFSAASWLTWTVRHEALLPSAQLEPGLAGLTACFVSVWRSNPERYSQLEAL